MLIAAFDFETTGLDRNQDRVTEVGAILYSTTRKHPLMSEGYLVDNEIKIPKVNTDLTGISNGMVEKFGLSSADALARLQNIFDLAETIAGKNIRDFDLPFYKNWCLREKVDPIEKPVIDIETDLPGVQQNKLSYMMADHGKLNPFPHQALCDALSVLCLIEEHPLDKVMERANSPRLALQAMVTFDTNYQAKEAKYRWDPSAKVWYKNLKEQDVEAETKAVPFDVKRISYIDQH